MTKHKQRPRVGLALGGGSARGWAHLGVIQALREADIPIDCVAGTSIGSLVGAFLAADRLGFLESFVLQFDWLRALALLDVVFPRSGLLDGRKVMDVMRNEVGDVCIEDLPMPYCAVATDLKTGEEVHLRSGHVMEAVRASISVPGMFLPVARDGRVLVDGGLVNPVPVNVVREMGADIVIAVDLNHDIVAKKGLNRHDEKHLASRPRNGATELADRLVRLFNLNMGKVERKLKTDSQVEAKPTLPPMLDVINATLQIMERELTRARLAIDPPDLLVQPPLGDIHLLDFSRGAEAIDQGRHTTEEALAARPGLLKPHG